MDDRTWNNVTKARKSSWAPASRATVLCLLGVLALVGPGGLLPADATAAGTAKAWGDNRFGQLCNPLFLNSLTPTPALDADELPLTDVSDVAAGRYHSLFIRAGGTVWTCGNDSGGQLGDSTALAHQMSPVQVKTSTGANLTGVVAIAAGAQHSVALKSDGTVWAWGANNYSEVGDGTTTIRPRAVQVRKDATTFLTNVGKIAAGGYHTMAIVNDSPTTAWAWGYNAFGQLGDGTTTNRSFPVQVRTNAPPATPTYLTGITGIDGGNVHSLALRTSDDTVWAWGADGSGQLGGGPTTTNADGTTNYFVDSSVAVQAGSGILAATTAIAAGGFHSLALKSDGTVRAWGEDGSGQLGDDISLANKPSPVPVFGLVAATAIGAGKHHSLAIEASTVWAWGDNGSGQLGDGTLVSKPIPVPATGSAPATDIDGGGNHSLSH